MSSPTSNTPWTKPAQRGVAGKPVARPPRSPDVQAYVRANLARFKVPREVIFVERLPRNATGKVLKRELEATA